MDQITENHPVAEREQRPPEPREIPGLVEVISGESVGGNAEDGRAGANAIYLGDNSNPKFIFTNYAEKEYGRPTDLTFRVIVPLKTMMDAIKKGGIPPPSLIESIHTELDDEAKDAISRRAVEHNAYEILDFLKRGGNTDTLPATPLMPDLEDLKSLSVGKSASTAPKIPVKTVAVHESGRLAQIRSSIRRFMGRPAGGH